MFSRLFRKFTTTLLFFAITFLGVFSFVFLKRFNSPENIEKRCTFKFQKDINKGVGLPDQEWYLNMELADDNYLKCMNIP